METKRYPHVTGLYGDSGENPGALAIHAVLDPSPNYPESGRVIVGSPATTPTIPGYIPNLGGFNGGPAAIERLASTLLEAAREVRSAMGEQPVAAPALDLDDLERKARGALDGSSNMGWRIAEHVRAVTPQATLALIAEVRRLEAIAKAATAFVDEQGKHVEIDAEGDAWLSHSHDFAAKQWLDLVRAVEGAGR